MNKKLTGTLFASAVAGLILGGQVVAEETKTPAKVQCSGINSCKGASACHTAENACAGQNSCKGKGWITVGSEKECTDKGGKVVKS